MSPCLPTGPDLSTAVTCWILDLIPRYNSENRTVARCAHQVKAGMLEHMGTSTAITTTGLTKTYGSDTVVDHLDLSVTAGTVHGLLGPNGSGKSTTMKMLLGLAHPTDGQITVLGEDMNRNSRAQVLSNVGSLIEQPSAYLHLTGAENMAITARLLGADARNIDWAIGLVQLGTQMDKLVKNYSLGMKQRLGLAMALLRDPQVLILDEPTNGLRPIVWCTATAW